ncbi:hypothetical protein [Pantoea agglomerans]|nr:hypothetical protein [Pantoea agglomerans]
MNSFPLFLRLGTLLSCPAWLRMVLTALLVSLLVLLTWWAII